MNRSSSNDSQRGSAIIMLFIALALFAALGFAFMQGSRNSTSMITDQQAKVYAQQMIAYGSDVKNAVKRLELRGCKKNQISFQDSSLPDQTWYENPNSPATKNCHVFDVSGGGLKWQNLPGPQFSAANQYDGRYAFATGLEWSGLGTTCGQPSCQEIVMFVHNNPGGGWLSKQMCDQLNNLLNVPSSSDADTIGQTFIGEFPVGGSTIANKPTSTAIAGKTAACVERGGGYLFLYAVLIQ